MTKTQLWTTIDLDAQGRQAGYLRLMNSSDDSPGGWIPIPVVSLRNGEGPRILLMAGNHGDEWDGQVMLIKLIQRLRAEDIRGHIIILPGINAPAVEAGKRTSPIDGGNLNRLFPGKADGTPTQMIAHYLETEILPRVEYAFDFHSGGNTGEFMPMAHAVLSADPVKRENVLEFFRVFGMPNSTVIEGLIGADTRLLGACERAGVHHMSTELGGAGRVAPVAVRLAEQGALRLLDHLGATTHRLATEEAGPTTFFRRQPVRDFLYAPARGLFEPYVELGAVVKAGEPAGAIHFTEEPWRPSVQLSFASSGTVIALRVAARVVTGDSLFTLGTAIDPITEPTSVSSGQ